MARDDDAVRSNIKTPVSFMVGRVTKEDTKSRSRSKLVRCGGQQVGATLATKDTNVSIGWDFAK